MELTTTAVGADVERSCYKYNQLLTHNVLVWLQNVTHASVFVGYWNLDAQIRNVGLFTLLS